MRIAVYTALFGNKDVLSTPIGYTASDHIDYILFTDDQELTSEIYQIHLKKAVFDDVAKNARYYKILGDSVLKDYDVLIWHDANIQLVHNQIGSLLEKAKHTFLTTFTHPHRDCFYSEAMTCIRGNKDFSLRILKQATVYFFKGMPAQKGMFSTGILIKNFTFEHHDTLTFWWEQTLKYSRRDQLSLAFTIFYKKAYINVIQDDIFNNKYSVYKKHIYPEYLESRNVMQYNFLIVKKLSFLTVKVLRKIKKIFR